MPVDIIISVTGVKYTNGDGYYFRLSQKLHNKLYLNCQVRSCRVRGNVCANFTKNDRIKYKGTHNHPPDHFEAEFCELERRILERSANEVVPLRRIFLEETTGASPRAVTRLNYPSFLRRMQRRRQFTKRKIPKSLTDFSKLMQSPDFSEFSNINGQPFFIDAIGNHSILYLSPIMRELLSSDDQTFSIYQFKKFVCQTLKQILIVVKIISNVAYPIAYVGMQLKSKTAYSEVFQRIHEEEPLWNPTTLYTGTDEGLVSAIQDVFPNCDIVNCWFHFAQEMRKEMRNLDLINLLHAELPFYSCIQMIQVLPLLPPDKLIDGLDAVKDRLAPYMGVPGVVPLLEYIQNCWFSGPIAEQVSLDSDPSRSNIELKLLNKQLMHSIRGNTRQDAIWSFTRSLIIIEKKYSDAFMELQQRGAPPKWTGNCSFKNHEKKIRNSVARYSTNKYAFDKYLEEITRTTMTAALDFNDDGDIEFADDNSDQYEMHDIEYDEDDPQAYDLDYGDNSEVKSEYVHNDDSIDFDDFIVEEVEEQEYSETESVEESLEPDLSPGFVQCESIENVIKEEKPDEKTKEPISKPKVLLVFSSDTSAPVEIEDTESEPPLHCCLTCKKKVYTHACQPCGHMCLCESCGSHFVNKKCPVCSKTTMWVQRIFLSHPLK